MKIRKKQKKAVAISILIMAIALSAALLFFYWQNQNIPPNDSSKETDSRVDIDYSPPTEEQKNGGGSAKKELANQDNATSKEEVSVELSAFRKTNGSVHVTANIRGLIASNGSCELIMTKDDSTKKQQSGIAAVTDYSTCEGFDISDLSKGVWQVQVNINSGNKSGGATTTVEV